MLTTLILGAVIAFVVILKNAGARDTDDKKTAKRRYKDGENGCMWLVIFIAGIILFLLLSNIV